MISEIAQKLPGNSNEIADSMISVNLDQRPKLPGLQQIQQQIQTKIEEELPLNVKTPEETKAPQKESEKVEKKPAKTYHKAETVRVQDWNSNYKIIEVSDPVQYNPPNEGLRERLGQKKIKKDKKTTEGQASAAEKEKKKKDLNKRRFKMTFKYLDDKGGRHSHTIYFGQTKTLYRCDGISKEQAQLVNNRITKQLNPFVPEYWVIMLLNKGPDLFENTDEFRKFLRL